MYKTKIWWFGNLLRFLISHVTLSKSLDIPGLLFLLWKIQDNIVSEALRMHKQNTRNWGSNTLASWEDWGWDQFIEVLRKLVRGKKGEGRGSLFDEHYESNHSPALPGLIWKVPNGAMWSSPKQETLGTVSWQQAQWPLSLVPPVELLKLTKNQASRDGQMSLQPLESSSWGLFKAAIGRELCSFAWPWPICGNTKWWF